jgi:hypothetical protein
MLNFDKDSDIKSKDTQYVSMFIKDGILYFSYKLINTMDLAIAQTCVRDRLEFTGGQSFPCLVDVLMLKNSTKEARDFLANEGTEGISANAILVESTGFKMMANFYIMVNKPKSPTRMFTDQESALEWLSQFKTQA